MDGFLAKQYSRIISVIQGEKITLPEISLVNGDIAPVPGTNGQVYGDYNVLISCFDQKITTSSCLNPITAQYAGADIEDDGKVDGTDYNVFLRELSLQHGG